MAGLTPTPKQQIFGSDGAPLVGGKIYTYLAGTSTPATTYTDFGAGTANTNPIILDSFGQANIWLLSTVSYKFIVRTATDVLLYTVDNITTPLDIFSLAAPPPIGNTTPNTGAFTTLTASGAVTLTGQGAMKLNAGTTAERPSPSNGMIRYNTTTAAMEGYINSAWTGLLSSADSSVVTLTGTQTLTNKTLTSPIIGGTPTGVGVLTSGTVVASTSGTSIDFASLPSWIKRVTLMFQGVSTNGSSDYQIRIGTSTVTTSGYAAVNVSTASTSIGTNAYTTGFVFVVPGGASASHSGSVTLFNITGNSWVSNGFVVATDTVRGNISAGSITLAGVLDIVRITTVNGTDTFDAGSINILYE